MVEKITKKVIWVKKTPARVKVSLYPQPDIKKKMTAL